MNLHNFAALYTRLGLDDPQNRDARALLAADLARCIADRGLIFVQAHVRPNHQRGTATVYLFTTSRVVVATVDRPEPAGGGAPPRTAKVARIPLYLVDLLSPRDAGFDEVAGNSSRIESVRRRTDASEPETYSPELWRRAHLLRMPDDRDVLVAQDLDADFEGGALVTFGDLYELLAAVGDNEPDSYKEW